jgi:DNA polymerase III sliding clamp (beta) subunit (PCNA family)
MKLNREELVEACKAVMSGVAEKEIVPQSSNFIFQNDRIYSFNDEIAVSHPFEVGFEGAVPAKEFLSFISKVKSEQITLKLNKDELLLVGSKAKAGLRIDSDIRLPIDEIIMSNDWNKLPEGFCKAVSFCLFSASKEQSKPILQNIHVTSKYVESCDNYRITRFNLDKSGKVFKDEELLIPAKSAKDIINHTPVEFSLSDGWLHFKNDNEVTFSCRRYEADYPKFDQFLESDGDTISFPKNLSEILDRGSVLSSDERVTISLEEKLLTVSSENVTGWFEESVEVDYEGEDVEFEIQPEFMGAILKYNEKAQVGNKTLLFTNKDFSHAVQLMKK